MHPRKPGSWLDPGAFGTLGEKFNLIYFYLIKKVIVDLFTFKLKKGVGAGFALGAKLVRPDSEVKIR